MLSEKRESRVESREPIPSQRPTLLSIIIVSWNTRTLLSKCLSSLFAQALAEYRLLPARETQPFAFEVLVVDNASNDGSPEMVRESFPWVRLVENHENVGFARANNQALQLGVGRYLLLLNPDTEVRPGALEALVEFMEEHPKAGAAGARLLNPDGTLQPSCYLEPTLARELWRLLHLDSLRLYADYGMINWPQNVVRKVDVVQGACLILRREALNRVGLLDETYFIYSEEVDLCYRLRQFGWEIYWVPEAEVVHYGGQSTRQVAAPMFIRLYQGKILYFRKHHGNWAARAYKAILLIAALARLGLIPLACLERSARRAEHLTLAAHYRRLIGVLFEL